MVVGDVVNVVAEWAHSATNDAFEEGVASVKDVKVDVDEQGDSASEDGEHEGCVKQSVENLGSIRMYQFQDGVGETIRLDFGSA